jgi:hypothetical protein
LFFDLAEGQAEGSLFFITSTAYRMLRHAIPHSSCSWLMANNQ